TSALPHFWPSTISPPWRRFVLFVTQEWGFQRTFQLWDSMTFRVRPTRSLDSPLCDSRFAKWGRSQLKPYSVASTAQAWSKSDYGRSRTDCARDHSRTRFQQVLLPPLCFQFRIVPMNVGHQSLNPLDRNVPLRRSATTFVVLLQAGFVLTGIDNIRLGPVLPLLSSPVAVKRSAGGCLTM